MREIVRTNDAVLITAIEALLTGANIRHVVLDRNMSVLEGSIGMLPRRILVEDEQESRARQFRHLDLARRRQRAEDAPLLFGEIMRPQRRAEQERKLQAALAYPEMRMEVQAALLSHGKRAFAVECLRPAATTTIIERFANEPPAYERLGQIRINEGRYGEVVRYRQHVLPVLTALREAEAR